MHTPPPMSGEASLRTLRPTPRVTESGYGHSEQIPQNGPIVDDDDLMARTAEGDEGAFRQLVERWERPVHSFVARMLNSDEEAMDLCQEAFLRAFREAPRYRASGRFRSWFFRIAGNLARTRLRRRKIIRWLRFDQSAHELPSPSPGPEASRDREETRRLVRSSLERLPVRQRQAIVMRRYHEMSYQEIAGAMQTTVPAVESLIQRGMASLRRDLADKGMTP